MEQNHLPELTPRQTEVLVLIARGLTSKQISQQLGISFKTVTSHRAHIMTKLNINDAVGLLRYAVRKKLIEP